MAKNIIPESSLTEDELKILKKKAFDVLSHARHTLLAKYPFIGSIALRMDLIPVRDLRVRTACTDGNSVYFDIAFLSSLSSDERIFVLAHEVWHAVLLHLTRRGTRNPELFNIATDKEVNYLLKEDGLIPPKDLCFPEGDEIGKCAEEIYEMLLKKMKKQQKQQNGKGNESSSNSSSSSSSSSSSGKNKSSSKSSGNNSNQDNGNQPNKNGNGGNQDGELKGQFDKHIYDGDEEEQKNTNQDNGNQPNKNGNGGNQDGDGSCNSQVTDKYGTVGYDSDFQPKVPKGFADRMRETVIAEAQRVEKMKGNVPAHVKELIKKFTAAEIDWKEMLASFVTKCSNDGNRSWIPPNRRHVHNDLYLQSRQATKIKAVVAIDTSGSTIGDRTKFLGELNGLINSFGHYELTIICADAEVDDVKTYTQDDNLNIEMDGYEMHGGGGTSFVPPFNYILDNKIECDCMLYLTDGFGPAPEKNPLGIPVMWVITKDGTEDFCDWGQKIRLKLNDEDIRQPSVFKSKM